MLQMEGKILYSVSLASYSNSFLNDYFTHNTTHPELPQII